MGRLAAAKDRLTGKKPAKMSQDFKDYTVLSTVQGILGRSQSDNEWRTLLATNYEILHDDAVEKLLEGKMYVHQYAADKEGMIILNKDQEPVVMQSYIDFDMTALRTLVSHVNRASFLTPKDAKLITLLVERTIVNIEMQMVEDDYNLGIGNFLDAIGVYVKLLLSDAINGRKARLLKEIPHTVRVGVTSEKQESKVF